MEEEKEGGEEERDDLFGSQEEEEEDDDEFDGPLPSFDLLGSTRAPQPPPPPGSETSAAGGAHGPCGGAGGMSSAHDAHGTGGASIDLHGLQLQGQGGQPSSADATPRAAPAAAAAAARRSPVSTFAASAGSCPPGPLYPKQRLPTPAKPALDPLVCSLDLPGCSARAPSSTPGKSAGAAAADLSTAGGGSGVRYAAAEVNLPRRHVVGPQPLAAGTAGLPGGYPADGTAGGSAFGAPLPVKRVTATLGSAMRRLQAATGGREGRQPQQLLPSCERQGHYASPSLLCHQCDDDGDGLWEAELEAAGVDDASQGQGKVGDRGWQGSLAQSCALMTGGQQRGGFGSSGGGGGGGIGAFWKGMAGKNAAMDSDDADDQYMQPLSKRGRTLPLHPCALPAQPFTTAAAGQPSSVAPPARRHNHSSSFLSALLPQDDGVTAYGGGSLFGEGGFRGGTGGGSKGRFDALVAALAPEEVLPLNTRGTLALRAASVGSCGAPDLHSMVYPRPHRASHLPLRPANEGLMLPPPAMGGFRSSEPPPTGGSRSRWNSYVEEEKDDEDIDSAAGRRRQRMRQLLQQQQQRGGAEAGGSSWKRGTTFTAGAAAAVTAPLASKMGYDRQQFHDPPGEEAGGVHRLLAQTSLYGTGGFWPSVTAAPGTDPGACSPTSKHIPGGHYGSAAVGAGQQAVVADGSATGAVAVAAEVAAGGPAAAAAMAVAAEQGILRRLRQLGVATDAATAGEAAGGMIETSGETPHQQQHGLCRQQHLAGPPAVPHAHDGGGGGDQQGEAALGGRGGGKEGETAAALVAAVQSDAGQVEEKEEEDFFSALSFLS